MTALRDSDLRVKLLFGARQAVPGIPYPASSSWDDLRRVRPLSRVVAIGLVALGCRDELPPPPAGYHLPTVVVSEAGLESPTAVVHDARADVYLVANAPAIGDARRPGFITRVSPAGKVVDRRWIDGEEPGVELHKPAALAIRGDTLFVADQDCVRLFHRSSGRLAGSICPGGTAEFVSLTVKGDTVLVTNRASAAESEPTIMSIGPGGNVGPVTGSTVSRPTGIAAGPWGVFVTSDGATYVSQIAPTGPRPVLRGTPKQIGGIVATRAGSFAFSNWTDSSVHYVDVRYTKGRGALYTLARQLAEPGQLGYDARRDRVLIPEAGRNRVTFVELLNTEGTWMPEYNIQ